MTDMTNFVDDIAHAQEEQEKEVASIKEHSKKLLEELRRSGRPLGTLGQAFADMINRNKQK